MLKKLTWGTPPEKEITMTTEEVAKKIVQYIHEGKNLQAEEELYDKEVISHEQNGLVVKGLEGVMAKTKSAMGNIEEFFGVNVAQTFVGADTFLLDIQMDMKPKGGERMQAKEYGFYKVKDGKVIEEYFYMQPLK